MTGQADNLECPGKLRVLADEDLTRGRLVRWGKGIHKIVYASDRWVIKRERHLNGRKIWDFPR